MIDNYEQKKLSQTRDLVRQETERLHNELKNIKTKVLRAREDMVLETSNVLGSLLDADNFENFINFAQYAEEIGNQEHDYKRTAMRLVQLGQILDSPYFARIDFKEEGYDDTEEIYIGRYSVLDESTRTYSVYDWRAPISSLYYDYGVGKASFKVPIAGEPGENEITGEITVKRQYQIEKGELIYLFDTELAIGDEILRMELSKTSDAKMKSIINSIQREQNKAIRSTDNHVLITGPAGSGKTSVGLHRLAYLLYRHRSNLTSARVRIFSPSPFFASYISGIIPELGEEDVETLDFPQLIWSYSNVTQNQNIPNNRVPRERKFLDQYEQIDFLSNALAQDERRIWLTEKYSPEFIAYLNEFLLDFTPSFTEDVLFNKDIICEKERMAELYKTRTTSSTLATKTNRVMTFVEQAYDEYFRENERGITELFEAINDDEFVASNEVKSYFEKEKSIVISDLVRRLMPRSERLYDRILRGWAKKKGLPISFAANALRQEKLFFEDALILFYIDLRTGWIPQDRNVRHILLDEAQDMSYVHHCILKQLFPSSNFTILADVNQALYPDINIHDLKELQDLYPAAVPNPLTKSYRNTYEISRFAANVLGVHSLQDEDSSFGRHGEEPKVIDSSDPVKTALEVVSSMPKGLNTIGILLSDRKAAALFYDRLKKIYPDNPENLPLHHIDSANDSFRAGVMVMAVPLAKGLEFDAVICPEYESQALKGEMGRKLLYLICTRALHLLQLIREV